MLVANVLLLTVFYSVICSVSVSAYRQKKQRNRRISLLFLFLDAVETEETETEDLAMLRGMPAVPAKAFWNVLVL